MVYIPLDLMACVTVLVIYIPLKMARKLDAVMEIKKRRVERERKVTWFDNYFGWLERLIKKLRKLIEEEEKGG